MPPEAADGEIAYWVNLVIQSDQGSPDQQQLLKKIPEHLFQQISDSLDNYYTNQLNQSFNETEIKLEYKNDPEYGIEVLKKRALGEGAIKLNDALGQVQPYARGKSMEEHHAAYTGEGAPSRDNLALLNSLKRDTGSANQTDILPHLFKQQKFFAGISDDLDKTIAVAREGFSQTYFLTRVRHRASGSIFRDMADTSFASELQAVDKTVASGEVVEKRVENINPFRGKFTFRTAYGPPPTSSLSQSQATYTATMDLGVPSFGSDYILYNTSTGSLHSGSYLFGNKPFSRDGSTLIQMLGTCLLYTSDAADE